MKYSWWHQCLSRIEKSTSLEELHRLCNSICQQLHIDHFLVFGGRLRDPTRSGLLSLSGFPEVWLQELHAPGNLENDPTLLHSIRSHLPLFWSDLAAEGQEFLRTAERHGLAAGLSLPVHGPAGLLGLLSLANRDTHPQPHRSLRLALPKASMVAGYLVTGLLNCSGGDNPKEPLTGREKDCLLWTAKGKTSWEISNILRIGERTVIYHLNNVLRKLGAANRQQAVAMACSMGLLIPELRLENPEAPGTADREIARETC